MIESKEEDTIPIGEFHSDHLASKLLPHLL